MELPGKLDLIVEDDDSRVYGRRSGDKVVIFVAPAGHGGTATDIDSALLPDTFRDVVRENVPAQLLPDVEAWIDGPPTPSL